MTINEANSIPKYQQLKEILKNVFQEENYQAGQVIPSENKLMENYHVSRNTVRKTLDEFLKEGVIYKQQGRGSFYAGTQPDKPNKSQLIGVIVPRLSSYIYTEIVNGIDHVVHAQNYSLVLGSSNADAVKERQTLDKMLNQNIDGLLIEPYGIEDPSSVPSLHEMRFEDTAIYERLKQLEIPVVLMDWMVEGPELSYVIPNDIEGGFRATQYLIEAGHRRIAYIGPYDTQPGWKRFEGYKKALAANDIPRDPKLEKFVSVLNNYASILNNSGLEPIIKDLMDLGKDRPTALFIFNDEFACRCLTPIKQLGLQIPDDISIIGFDDSELATLTDVQLTTMVHPKYGLGQMAAEMLFKQVHNNNTPPIQILINPTIAIRNSVKVLSNHAEST